MAHVQGVAAQVSSDQVPPVVDVAITMIPIGKLGNSRLTRELGLPRKQSD